MGIQFIQVSKKQRGAGHGLRGVSFEVETGVLAVLGPAGAGKTSLLSLIAALDQPSGGSIRVDGCDTRKQATQVRRRIGFVPEEAGLLPDLTVYEMLDYLALLCNLDLPAARQLRISRVMERFNLTLHRDQRIRALPPGVHRRVALAQACLGQISTLLLDEPTRNLPETDAWEVRSVIAALGQEYLVLVGTSSPAEAEALAERVLILHEGRVLAYAAHADLLELVRGQVWRLEFDGRMPPLPPSFLRTGLTRVDGKLTLRGVAPASPVPEAQPVPPTLEDAYVWILARDSRLSDSPDAAPAAVAPVGIGP